MELPPAQDTAPAPEHGEESALSDELRADLKKVVQPRVLPYDRRHPLLPGYHPERRPSKARLIAGSSVLTAGHLLTIAAAYNLNELDAYSAKRATPTPEYSLIPLAGPFLVMLDTMKSSSSGFLFMFIYLPLAGMQLTGAIVLLTGTASHTVQVEDTSSSGRDNIAVRLTGNGLAFDF